MIKPPFDVDYTFIPGKPLFMAIHKNNMSAFIEELATEVDLLEDTVLDVTILLITVYKNGAFYEWKICELHVPFDLIDGNILNF